MDNYDYELAKQTEFYEKYLPLVSSSLTADDVRIRSTDGLIWEVKVTVF